MPKSSGLSAQITPERAPKSSGIRSYVAWGAKLKGRLFYKEGAEAKVMELWERLRPMNVDMFAREALREIERNKPIIIVPSF